VLPAVLDDLFPDSLSTARAAAPRDLPEALRDVPDEHRDVMLAFALGATHRARTWIVNLLGDLGARDRDGRRYTTERVRDCMHELDQAGTLVEHPQRAGFWRLAPALDNAVLGWALDRPDHDTLVAALTRTEQVHGPNGKTLAHFVNPDTAVAVLRLSLFAGEAPKALARWHAACRWMEWNDLVDAAPSASAAARACTEHPAGERAAALGSRPAAAGRAGAGAVG
jgi:hypothetical protein